LFAWRREARRKAEARIDAPPFVPAVVETANTAASPNFDAANNAAVARPHSIELDIEGSSVSGPGRMRLVATKAVDFRKGAEGLAALVREVMRADPFDGAIYVFRAKRADRVKLVFWDGTGVCLFAKRLEDGQFRWPKIEDGVSLAFCWSHVRRRFHELAVGGASRRSIETRATFAAEGLNNGATFARPELDRSSPISSRGCARSSASSAREQTRRGDPLCARVLGGSDPVPRRRSDRDRLQYGRALDQTHRP
jgi:hypothetical protein